MKKIYSARNHNLPIIQYFVLTRKLTLLLMLLNNEHTHNYLQRCLALAKQAAEKGNSPVGAVIVKDDEIISEAEEAVKTKNDVSCHAEMEAIRQAVKKLNTNNLSACSLYTTHEPCVMCSYAIRFYKISEVIYLHQSKYLGGVSSSMPLLTTTEVSPAWSKPPVIHHVKEEGNI